MFSLGFVIGCALMFLTLLVWSCLIVGGKEDEEEEREENRTESNSVAFMYNDDCGIRRIEIQLDTDDEEARAIYSDLCEHHVQMLRISKTK